MRRLNCGALVDFSETLKIISECIFWLESLELQLLAPISEMPMWLVFLVIQGNVLQAHETAAFWR